MENENMENLEPDTQGQENDDTLSLNGLDDMEAGGEADSSQLEPGNLEKYGVWVKVEPTDVEDTQTEKDDSTFNLEDLETEEAPAAEEVQIPEEDFGLDEDTLAAAEETADSDLESLDTTTETDEDLDMDLELEEELTESEKAPQAGAGQENMDNLEELSVMDENIKDVSLDELGISIDAKAGEEQEKKTFETTPTETEDYMIHDAVTADSDDGVPPLDIDLDFPSEEGDTEKSAGEEIIFDESDEQEKIEPMEELPELETGQKDEGEEIELEEIGEEEQFAEPEEITLDGDEVEVPLSSEPNVVESFDGLEEIEEKTESLKQKVKSTAESDISSKILLKIEEELKSIKIELSALKQEIGSLRNQKSAGKADSGTKQKKEQDADEESFFAEGEEEDETIALTGEELDNILTTADIKEEQEENVKDTSVESLELVDQEDILDYQTGAEKEQTLEELDLEEESSPASKAQEGKAEAEEDFLAEENVLEMELADLPSGDESDMELSAGEDAESGPPKDEIEIEIPELDEEPTLEGKNEAEMDTLDTLEGLEVVEEPAAEEAPVENLDAELSIEPIADASLEEDKEVSSLEMDIAEVPTESIAPAETAKKGAELSPKLKEEIKSVLSYMDQLLEALPEDKIQEFAHSEYFEVYKRLFEELGLAS